MDGETSTTIRNQNEPGPAIERAGTDPASFTPPVAVSIPAHEQRLLSALVVMIALGLFLALPFVLSIGSVVFLPLFAGLIVTIFLSPLADKLATWGIPNTLASILALLIFFGVLALALTAVLTPAVSLYDRIPALIAQVREHFTDIWVNFVWIDQINEQLGQMSGDTGREVVLAGPSMLQQVALATPTVLLETLLTFLLAFFMLEARIRLRRRLLLDRAEVGSSLKAARAIREVQDRVAAYILTVGLINTGVGVVVALAAWAWGLEAPIMWGGLAMLLNFVPYVGPLAMMVLLGLFGLGSSDSVWLGLVPMLAYLGLHTVEANVVTPSILGARFTMNPVMILLALSYFGWIWGVIGALLSVPILLTLTALVDHLGRPNFIGFLFGEPLFDHPPADAPAPIAPA